MDWELYERQRAIVVFISLAVVSFLLLAFQRTVVVQHVKAFFVSCTFPTQRLFSQWTTASVPEKPAVPLPPPAAEVESTLPPTGETTDAHAEQFRALHALAAENQRLNGLLELKRDRWPHLVAAHVVSRDPQRWFQEALLDKGRGDGINVDDPVIAYSDRREALIGRIVEAGAHTSRVMLIHDSLSSVPATVVGTDKEDGVVEGSNSHDLYVKYLIRDSHVKIGDTVVTSGLGGMFPAEIPIGWVQEVSLDQRQLFIQAKLRPRDGVIPAALGWSAGYEGKGTGMKKVIFYVVTVLFVLWVQMAINYFIASSGFSVNVVICAVLYFGFARGPLVGEVCGFSWGLLIDASSLGLLGLHSVLYAAAGFVGGLLRRQLDEHKVWTQAIFTLAISIFYVIFYFILDRLFSAGPHPISWSMAAQPIINAAVAPLFFWIMQRWSEFWDLVPLEE